MRHSFSRTPRLARPSLEALESRLPPGDLLSGVLFGPPLDSAAGAWEAEAVTQSDADPIGSIPKAPRETFSVLAKDQDSDRDSSVAERAPPAVDQATFIHTSHATRTNLVRVEASPVAGYAGGYSANPTGVTLSTFAGVDNPPVTANADALLLAASLVRPESRTTTPRAERASPGPARHFEQNVGQTDGRVQFLTRGDGYTLFLTPGEAVFALGEEVVRMQFVGANPMAQVVGADALPGKVNYFLGNDPARWHTNVPTFASVVQDEVYPGVDLVWYGNGRDLEYDFVVAPGADPDQVALRFENADRLELGPDGALLVHAGGQTLRQHRPLVYQEGNDTRTEIGSHFVIGADRVSFEVAEYDTSRPLVIDPVLSYSSYLGGDGTDWAHSIGVDWEGNMYATGRVDTPSQFPLQDPLQGQAGGGSDAFVSKFSADGSTLLYSTYLGGWAADEGQGIVVDWEGNAYLAGRVASPNFPVVNAIQGQIGGGFFGDAFVTKLDPTGSALLFSTYLGGSGQDGADGIALDWAGNVSVSGLTSSANFPTANAVQDFLNGPTDAFITKLAGDGSAFVFSTYFGGSGLENNIVAGTARNGSVAADWEGNVYVTGRTNSEDFPVVNALQPTYGGGDMDAFVVKLTPDGSGVYYATYLGGSGEEFRFGGYIATDGYGNAYVTGSTFSADFPTFNALYPTLRGQIDAVVSAVAADGSGFIYSTYLGGTGSDLGRAIAVDWEGNAYVAAEVLSRDFPLADPLQSTYGGGRTDAGISKISADGSALLFSTFFGGSGEEIPYGILTDYAGTLYLAGRTASLDFRTEGAFQPSYGGGITDAFVMRISEV